MTISQIKKKFPTIGHCLKHLEKVYWAGSPKCPYCGNSHASSMPNENRYHCNSCHTSFSVTVGTPFHRTRMDLRIWFLAIDTLNLTPEISLREFGDKIGVTKDTARLIKNRISVTPKEILEKILNFNSHD